MRLVFPDWLDESSDAALDYDGLSLADKKVCIDRSYTQDQIDKFWLDVWRSKIKSLDTKLRTKAKEVIGTDSDNWEMIKKVYKDITKQKQH